MASLPIKPTEIRSLHQIGVNDLSDSEQVIGLDGIAVLESKNNKIDELSIQQLKDIFSGKITSWRQLGVVGNKINVYARDNDSGTYDTFRSLVLGKKVKLVASAKRYESNASLSDDVSRDKNGIGFVGLP